MIMEKAKFFHSKLNLSSKCEYSRGWLQNFKKRHGIHKLKAAGEKASADYLSATLFVDDLAEYISKENITNEQIYNGDETSLFWKCFPENSLGCHYENVLDGHKNSKERITVLVCANAAGTHKCTPFVIGKSARPRALKNIRELPVIYKANKKAWVTQTLFLEWFEKNFVKEVQQHFKRIGLKEDSKILLLLDNCPAHPEVEKLIAENVVVKYLPPNCTSLIQPMDQGAIWSFKSHYRKTQMQKLVTTNNLEEFKKSYNIKDALYNVSNAWRAVTPSVLKNVWNNLLCPQSDEAIDLIEYIPSIVNISENLTREEAEKWVNCDTDVPSFPILTDEELLLLATHHEIETESSSQESDEDDIIVPTISLQEAINASITILDFLENSEFSNITEQDKLQLYRVQEKLLVEKNKVKKKKQST